MKDVVSGVAAFVLLMCCSTSFGAIIADFNGSTPGEDLSVTNLDAGSAAGSWTVVQAGRVNSVGGGGQEKIGTYSDAAGDNYFQLDGPRADKEGGSRATPFNYLLTLDSAVALDGSQVLALDALVTRSGGASTTDDRNGLIRGLDASGDVLFELVIDGADASTRGTIGLVGQAASSEVISFFVAGSTPATTDMTTIEIALGASTFDVVVGGNTAYSGIAYTDSVTDLSEIQFTASGPDAGYAGYTIDNVEVVPEPASLCLVGMGVAIALFRRRRM